MPGEVDQVVHRGNQCVRPAGPTGRRAGERHGSVVRAYHIPEFQQPAIVLIERAAIVAVAAAYKREPPS